MSAIESRRSNAHLRRLQLLLLLMILWDLLAVMAQFSFGGDLMGIDGDEIDGLLAARASFNGALLVPIAMYVYALVRNPLRHRVVLHAAVVQQLAAILFAVYHVTANDIAASGAVLPLAASVLFLALVLVNMPRGQVAT